MSDHSAAGAEPPLRPLAACRLYGILDLGYVAPTDALEIGRRMLAGGVDILQIRAKQSAPAVIVRLATELRPLTRAMGVPLIVNDFPVLAAAAEADGVHIGQDDGPIAGARSLAGAGKWVGRSTHSVAQACGAREEGADYLGFGPLFATPTKPDYPAIGLAEVARVHAEVRDRPIFCIGGIKLENLPEVIAAGARRVVMVSGLLQAPDVAAYAARAAELLAQYPLQ
jgi:thiamine-phosphate pyrophosphorylase